MAAVGEERPDIGVGATVLIHDANVNEDAERPERERSGIAQ